VISSGKEKLIDTSPILSRQTVSGSMDPINMKPWGLETTQPVQEEQVRCQIATEEVDVQCGDMVRITLLNEAECDTVLAAEIASQDSLKEPASVVSLIGRDGTLNAPLVEDFNSRFGFQQQPQKEAQQESRMRPWSWEEETQEDHQAVGNARAVRKVKVLKIRALNVLAKLEVEDVCEKIARATFNPAKESAMSCNHKWSQTCCPELQSEELIVKDLTEKDRFAQLLAEHQATLTGKLSGLKSGDAVSSDLGAIFRPVRTASVKPASRPNPF